MFLIEVLHESIFVFMYGKIFDMTHVSTLIFQLFHPKARRDNHLLYRGPVFHPARHFNYSCIVEDRTPVTGMEFLVEDWASGW